MTRPPSSGCDVPGCDAAWSGVTINSLPVCVDHIDDAMAAAMAVLRDAVESIERRDSR